MHATNSKNVWKYMHQILAADPSGKGGKIRLGKNLLRLISFNKGNVFFYYVHNLKWF
jgi:hypothetical protein